MADKKILLSGYFGFGNCGDEIILYTEKKFFENLGYEVFPIYRASKGSNGASGNLFNTIAAIRQSDIIVSGGGGLLQDKTSLKSLFYYLFILFTGRVFGKKTVCFAQGIGPLNTALGRFVTRKVVSGADLITVRDKYSKNVLKSCGIKKPINVCADVAFLFDEEEGISLPYEKFVIFSPGYSRSMPSIDTLSNIANIMKKESGFPVVIAPLYPKRDGEVALKISKKTGFPLIMFETIGQCLYAFEKSEFVVGMRYHSVVLSALAKKAFVSMSYDPKVSAISEEFGIEYVKDYGGITEENFSEIFRLNFSSRREIEKKLAFKLSEMKKRAEENFKLFEKNFSA